MKNLLRNNGDTLSIEKIQIIKYKVNPIIIKLFPIKHKINVKPNNDNAFDDSSIERSYIKLTQRAIEKNKRLSPEEITSVVFQIPTDATE
mgnify:CR=1 FL=1